MSHEIPEPEDLSRSRDEGVPSFTAASSFNDRSSGYIQFDMLSLAGFDQGKIDRIVATVPGAAKNVQDIYPLSPLQEGMLFHHLRNEQSDAYVLTTLFEFQSQEQLRKFIGGLQGAIVRHDALRTAVIWENLPRPVQVVCRDVKLPIEKLMLDARRSASEQLRERMRSACQGIDLRRAPLLQLQIARDESDERWYALLHRHHIVFDHQSWNVLFSEVLAGMLGRDRELKAPRSCRDYVAWSLATSESQDAQAFFRSKFGDVEEGTVPFGLRDDSDNAGHIGEVCAVMDSDLEHQIRTRSQSLGLRASRLFHAAWALVVAQASGRDDVTCGTVVSGSRQAKGQAQPMIGLFVNTLPLRLRLRSVTTREFVSQTHRELTDLLEYRQVPPTVAQRCSGIAGNGPLFTAVLNYRHSAGHSVIDANAEVAAIAGVRVIMQKYRTSYPIMLVIDDFGDAFKLTAQADSRIEPGRIIGYMLTALQSLIRALDTKPHSPVLSISVLPEQERRQIIEEFNATQTAYPREKTVHELFEQQVNRSPDAVAVAYEKESLTYSELNIRANWLARSLRECGVGPDQLVAIYVHRSLEMIVGLLGVLKAGGAYVPLDPLYPEERLKYILDDTRPRVLLTQERLRGAVSSAQMDILVLDSMMQDVPDKVEVDLGTTKLGTGPENLMYVIYTSGTTGRPKGIAMPHGPIVNLIEWHRKALRSSKGKRVLQFAALTFDVASQEIFSTLCTGGSLLLIDEWLRRDARALSEFLISGSIQRLFIPPLMLQSLAECDQAQSGAAGALEEVITAGEQLRITPEVSNFFQRHERCVLHNHYGPTETHVATAMTLTGDSGRWPLLPIIGHPISNTKIYVLNGRLLLVPMSVAGEVYIGGIAVARGYLGKPELTAERFIADPHGAEPGARLYRTGDLGRVRADGGTEYLGRNDDQVKVRGYRIEPREIEAQLLRHEHVKDAAVVVREDVPGEKRLVGYVALNDNAQPNVEKLRRFLKETLPAYMVPNALVILASFPLTTNGKLDRSKLPAPANAVVSDQAYDPPQGELEEMLAELWRELLQVERVGRDDNFFDLGGHSLLALKALSRMNYSVGAALRVLDLYKSPTIRELAIRIDGKALEDAFIDLSREAVVPAEIAAKPGARRTLPQGILLTGVTGFVGRFLLVQLLKDTDDTIYCLVRASSQSHAQSRIRVSLARWDLWCDEFERRIVGIPGDLRLPRLGIDKPTYQLLSHRVYAIYHCATSMNHLETYEMAKVANVGSAKELLTLATTGEPKVVNYISTLGIFSSSVADLARTVDEESTIDHEKHRTSRGYVASKWVAERVFMTAGERGIPCNIFRLGLVWGDTKEGRYDELQREYRVLKSCLLSGRGVRDYRYDMAPIPVDSAVRAVVYLANRHLDGNGVFHICSSVQVTEGLFERCNEIAHTSFDLISFYEWIHEMKRIHQGGRSLPVVPLIEFAFSMDEESLRAHLRRNGAVNLRIESDRTRRELEEGGLTLEALSDDLLKLSLESMFLRDPDMREFANSNLRFRKRIVGA